MENVNKIIVSQGKLKQGNESCKYAPRGTYCQEYNLQALPITQTSQVVKSCMEDLQVYIYPGEGDLANTSS
jgi:hypothetical protein